MSRIPTLEPRGSGSRPKPILLLVGKFVTGFGLVRFLLWVLDLFGRGESALDIYRLLPHFLAFLGTPTFSGLSIVTGFVILGLQGHSFEKAPKKEIIHPRTLQPIRRKSRMTPGMKHAVWALIGATIVALPIWAVFRTPLITHLHFPAKSNTPAEVLAPQLPPPPPVSQPEPSKLSHPPNKSVSPPRPRPVSSKLVTENLPTQTVSSSPGIGNSTPEWSGGQGQSGPNEEHRKFTDKNPVELLSPYHQGLTTLQADKLFAPFGGQWVKTSGKVVETGDPRSPYVMIDYGPYRSQGAPQGAEQLVECRFDPAWLSTVERYNKGDSISVIGKLSEIQNGAQLYVNECEILR